jgi:hypothetical protein
MCLLLDIAAESQATLANPESVSRSIQTRSLQSATRYGRQNGQALMRLAVLHGGALGLLAPRPFDERGEAWYNDLGSTQRAGAAPWAYVPHEPAGGGQRQVSRRLERTALMGYLKASDEAYHAKVLELREAVTDWLGYIPQTFPHYTLHTVGHSDEIISQLSLMLFKEESGSPTPVVGLSAAEVYVLIAAAYLHDAGMVVPDRAKLGILASDEWRSWTTGDGGGAGRWAGIEAFRAGPQPPDDAQRHFLADVQVRFLLAEFARRTHAERAAELISQHEGSLGRFAFGDPLLKRTIAEVCAAHGLRPHELEDRERYPDRRDVGGGSRSTCASWPSSCG